MKKCGEKKGKVVLSKGVEMPYSERIKEVEENGFNYLGILEYSEIKEREMKDNFRRTKLILKNRLSDRNKIITINTWTLSLMRYDADIVKWRKGELDEIDRENRKVMRIRTQK